MCRCSFANTGHFPESNFTKSACVLNNMCSKVTAHLSGTNELNSFLWLWVVQRIPGKADQCHTCWCHGFLNLKSNDRLNSLAPGRFQFNFRWVIFKLTLVNGGWGISYEMVLDLTDDKSTLVWVMAWCHQETSHYLSQCWHRSMLSNGITRPQWVNIDYPGT